MSTMSLIHYKTINIQTSEKGVEKKVTLGNREVDLRIFIAQIETSLRSQLLSLKATSTYSFL